MSLISCEILYDYTNGNMAYSRYGPTRHILTGQIKRPDMKKCDARAIESY